jgi:hypothetical protein
VDLRSRDPTCLPHCQSRPPPWLSSCKDSSPAGVAGAVLNEPWATLGAEDFIRRMEQKTPNLRQDLFAGGLKEISLVPPAG